MTQARKAPDSTRFYDRNAAFYLAMTVAVDMSGPRSRFMAALPAAGAILDAGSGSGRDALAFMHSGYRVEAFDASPEMVQATAHLTGIAARQMRFEDFEWEHQFDGIWACASLLHVARADLAMVLNRLAVALKPEGVIYASFKHGSEERETGDRYFNDMTAGLVEQIMGGAPELDLLDTWFTPDQVPDRQHGSWLNILARRQLL